jgi:hypothetical protein
LSWRDEPLSFQEELELQKMNYTGPKPRNRGEFRDIWEKFKLNDGQDYHFEIDLYHMTSINNLESILTYGLLSEYEIDKLQLIPDHISNPEIVEKRMLKRVDGNYTLYHYALLYFQPRNAMLYEIIHNNSIKQKIIILRFSYDVSCGGFFTTRHALQADEFYRLDAIKNNPNLKRNTNLIQKDSWHGDEEAKSEMMAEALIFQKLGSEHLREIYYFDQNLLGKLREKLSKVPSVKISNDAGMFFQ